MTIVVRSEKGNFASDSSSGNKTAKAKENPMIRDK